MIEKNIELEKEFDNFISLNGFTRVSIDIGDSPQFPNADYIYFNREDYLESIYETP